MNGDSQKTGLKNEAADGNQSTATELVGLFCEKFRCQERKFEKRLLLECLHPQGAGLARVICLVNPGYFRSDFGLIEQLKHATSFDQVKRLVDFYGTQDTSGGFLRLMFKVRLSKQRLLTLAQNLFSTQV